MLNQPRDLQPDWPAADNVRTLITTREDPQAVSKGRYASFNLGMHCGDAVAAVQMNRQRLADILPTSPLWLKQVHGKQVIRADEHQPGIEADACIANNNNQVCAVLTADCLPVLLCDEKGSSVAAVHAGWRGLYQGIIAATVAKLLVPTGQVLAWLGPAISQPNYQVDARFYERFITQNPAYELGFQQRHRHWYADLYVLAKVQLEQVGVKRVYGGHWCTYAQSEQFYSYRRDAVCGRQASLIWLAEK